MSNESPGIDIIELHDAIERSIAAGVSGLSVVPAYSRVEGDTKPIPSPAAFIMLTDADLAAGSSTDQTAAKLNFLAFVVVRFTAQQEQAHRDVRRWAMNLAHYIHGNRFGMRVQRATVGVVGPAELEPEEPGFETWQVPFSVEANIGVSTFDSDTAGTVPNDVRVSTEPLTGIPHEPDYVQVVTPPTV